MRILLLEDNPDHAELICESLRRGFGEQIQIEWQTLLTKALSRLNQSRPDLFLCDLQLPDSPIAATVEQLQELTINVPVVVLTSFVEEETEIQLMREGIQDFFPKDQLESQLLWRICRHAVERHSLLQRLASRNADQEQFCFSLCHDFKEPIRKIGTALDLLEQGLREENFNNKQTDWPLSTMRKNVQLLNSITDGLFAFLRLDGRGFESVDLNRIVVNVMADLSDAQRKCVRVTKLPEIFANPAQMQLMFKNLIENALKYNRSESPEVSIGVELASNDHGFVLSVQDNGIGMPGEHLQEVLKPFRRLVNKQDYSGSGLGLSIVKRIVESHAGNLEIRSELGKGSEIRITLPLGDVAHAGQERSSP